MGLEYRIVRIARHQGAGLFKGLRVFLPFAQDLDIVETQLDIVGLQLNGAFEQEVGILVHAEP